MGFAVALLFNGVAIGAGVGAGVLARQRSRLRRVLVAIPIAALVGALLFGRDGPLPLSLSPWLRPAGWDLPFLPSLILAGGVGCIAWLNRWSAAATVVAIYGLAVLILFGLVPIFGWGAVALPPLMAGLLVAAVRPRRRAAQAGLVCGWLLIILTPATLSLSNAIDQLEWEIARATTGYFRDYTPVQIAAVIDVARQREVAAVALYLLVTLGTLAVASIPVIEHLIDALPRARVSVGRSH